MQSRFAIVLTTTDSRESAHKMAHALVERRLAACVNIVPAVESVYRWKGKAESASEFLLIIKTRREKFESIQAAIHELHAYELPECILLDIAEGSEPYLNWIAESMAPEEPPDR